MWGDDPNDYKEMELDLNDHWVRKLPIQEKLSCGCIVDLEWIFMASDQFATCCIATGVRLPDYLGNQYHGPHDVDEKISALTGELFRRYQKHIAKAAAPMTESNEAKE